MGTTTTETQVGQSDFDSIVAAKEKEGEICGVKILHCYSLTELQK